MEQTARDRQTVPAAEQESFEGSLRTGANFVRGSRAKKRDFTESEASESQTFAGNGQKEPDEIVCKSVLR
jgi:hypothetical protein